MSADSLSHLNAFIFDLDGVIWKGHAPIEGAVESIARLRAAGKRCFYCTNNSRQNSAEFAAVLRSIGIECDDEDVMTSSVATALYLQSLFTGPFTAYVIGEEGLVQTIRRTGAIVMTSPVTPQRTDLYDVHGAVDCVIVGIDAGFGYHKLRVAQRLILGGSRFIATNRDSTYPTPYGLIPGAGSIVAAVETATGISPVTLGKPQPLMAQLLMQKFNLKKEETAMVGDRLDTDMVFARRAEIGALFVATGVHTLELAAKAKNLQKPDALFENLPALCDAVLGSPSNSTDETSATTDAATVSGTTAVGMAAGAATVAASTDSLLHKEPAEALNTPFAVETRAGQGPIAPQALVDAAAFNDQIAHVNEEIAETSESLEQEAAADVEVTGEAATESESSTAPVADFSWDLEPPAPATASAESAAVASDAAGTDANVFAFAGDNTETAAVVAEPASSPFAIELNGGEGSSETETAAANADGEEAKKEEDDNWWETIDNG